MYTAHNSHFKLVYGQFSELSEDVILHIFSFIPFRLLRRTICRVCKMWHRIASDPAIVRKASSHEFESIRLCDTINDGS